MHFVTSRPSQPRMTRLRKIMPRCTHPPVAKELPVTKTMSKARLCRWFWDPKLDRSGVCTLLIRSLEVRKMKNKNPIPKMSPGPPCHPRISGSVFPKTPKRHFGPAGQPAALSSIILRPLGHHSYPWLKKIKIDKWVPNLGKSNTENPMCQK